MPEEYVAILVNESSKETGKGPGNDEGVAERGERASVKSQGLTPKNFFHGKIIWCMKIARETNLRLIGRKQRTNSTPKSCLFTGQGRTHGSGRRDPWHHRS